MEMVTERMIQPIEKMTSADTTDKAELSQVEAETSIALFCCSVSVRLTTVKRLLNPIFCSLVRQIPIKSLPSSRTFRRRLASGFPQCYQYICKHLNEFYSIAIDESMDRAKRPIIAIVLSTWDRTVLADVKFPGCISPTGNVLAAIVKETLDRTNVRVNDCIGWISDNGRNVISAGEFFSSYISMKTFPAGQLTCLAHGLNLISGCFATEFKNVGQLVQNVSNFLKGANIYTRRTALQQLGVRISALDPAYTRWNTWQNCVSEIVKRWDILLDFVKRQRAHSDNCKSIVLLMEDKQCHAAARLMDNFGDLIVEMTTRAQADHNLTINDIAKLESLKRQLSAFADGTADPIIEFSDIFESSELNPEQTTTLVNDFTGACRAAVKKWKDNIEKNVKWLKAVTIFDPRHEHSGSLSQQLGLTVTSGAQAEFDLYCLQGAVLQDPVEYWKTEERKEPVVFPRLVELAKKFLALRPSSAAVERCFSMLRDLQTPRRVRMSAEYIRQELILRYNSEMVQDYLKLSIKC